MNLPPQRPEAARTRENAGTRNLGFTIYPNTVHRPLCKIIPSCLIFRALDPAGFSYQPRPAKPAIFGKIGGKTINLAGSFLHNGVVSLVDARHELSGVSRTGREAIILGRTFPAHVRRILGPRLFIGAGDCTTEWLQKV